MKLIIEINNIEAKNLSNAYADFTRIIYTPSPKAPPSHSATTALINAYVTDTFNPEKK